MNIDYNLYKIFLYLYEERSISKTASKLYVSQPAISYSLKELENSLGYTLFHRNSKGIEPTLEAKELYNYIKTAFNILNDAEEHVKNLNDLTIGTIKIGIPLSLGIFPLINYIEKMRKDYPNIKFDIISKKLDEIIKMLEEKELDMIIGISPINSEKKLTKINILEANTCFIYNKKILKDINIKKEKDLLKYPLILPSEKTNIRNKLDSYMETKNIRLNPILETSTTETMLEMVKNGIGIGYVIKDIINKEPNKDDLEIIMFKDLKGLDISIAYIDEYTSIATRKFINLIKK